MKIISKGNIMMIYHGILYKNKIMSNTCTVIFEQHNFSLNVLSDILRNSLIRDLIGINGIHKGVYYYKYVMALDIITKRI